MSIVLNFRAPKWNAIGFALRLQSEVGSYRHTIKANSGYWSASINLPSDLLDAEDWFADGLGRHIETYADTIRIWEGFVNSITIRTGQFTATRGPLLDVANRVNVRYTPIDNSTDPPVRGVSTETGEAEDTDSQDLYGIRYKILSTGDMTTAQAEQLRDTYLSENKLPAVSRSLSSQAAGEIGITLDCVGYVQVLDWPYADTTTGTRTTDAQIKDVLGDDPELTWDTVNVDANALTVDAYDNDLAIAWSVIQDTIAHGGTSDERWLFQIRNDLEAWYYAAPTTLKYQLALSDPSLTVRELTGETVESWRIQAGQWILISDFLAGAEEPDDLREDQRAMFIEELTFTAPEAFSLRGGKLDTMPQLLKNMGLGGIGA